MRNLNKWCVYCHTFPNGKRYIGITSQTPEYRWNNGRGYSSQKVVARAICKHGWNNIVSEILYFNITKSEATTLEIKLIEEYKTTNPQYGYNLTIGGEGHNGFSPSIETREKIRISNKGRKRTAEFCERMRLNNLGKTLTSETREKIRQANLKRGPAKLSEEGRQRIRENSRQIGLANKGRVQSVESNEARSRALKGKPKSENTKQKMRKPKSPEAVENMRKASAKRWEEYYKNKGGN